MVCYLFYKLLIRIGGLFVNIWTSKSIVISVFCLLFVISLFNQSVQLTGAPTSAPIHKNVVIIGTGPAGLTAAIYTARAGYTTSVIEGREPGGQISLSYMVENFPGFPEGISGFDLTQRMREQSQRFGAETIFDEVMAVDLSIRPFKLTMSGGNSMLADTLIIASGAAAKWLGLPSELALIGKGVGSCAVCDAFFYKDKEVVVVGGGDVAMEDALYLTKYASKVTVVHRRDTLKASKLLQDRVFSNPKVHFVWNSVIDAVEDPAKGAVTAVMVRHLDSGESERLPCDGLFIAIGHTPNTAIFKGQLDLVESEAAAGYIVVEPFSTKTSVQGVFAAGDVADMKYRQAITASGLGAMAGIEASEFLQSQQ